MPLLNVEIKARYTNSNFMRQYLLDNNAEFKGTDNQIDTYFNVPNGRLKLREGNIENNLIYYERNNQPGPKSSSFDLIAVPDAGKLKEMLSRSLGIKVIVRKNRQIYFIGNVKFHIDEVPGLGNFAEIEASNKYADLPLEKLQQQCDFYKNELMIGNNDLISISYSDMVIDQAK
ncbi:MAG: class IV adenylate cyclase [Bacteroidetes bacterium]|nr:class IV adenylate cyclase [Bacteroidota bacterium]